MNGFTPSIHVCPIFQLLRMTFMSRNEPGERLDQSVSDDLPPHLEVMEQNSNVLAKDNVFEMKAAENAAYSKSTDSIGDKNPENGVHNAGKSSDNNTSASDGKSKKSSAHYTSLTKWQCCSKTAMGIHGNNVQLQNTKGSIPAFLKI